MKSNRVEKQCEICGNIFIVIKSRKYTAKYCKRKCYDIAQTKKVPWNKGRTWEELYGNKKASELKLLIQTYSLGQNNPMFGKIHSDESKEKMSIAKDGYIPWNTGKKYPGIFFHVNRLGENNAYIKHILKEEGITYEQYKNKLSDKERYYRAVMSITKLQSISVLEHYEKRARGPDENAYHLDHVYPVIRGFEDGIPPEIIGDISNLRFIPWKENVSKSDQLLDEARKILYAKCISN
jgi:hypothetical protein